MRIWLWGMAAAVTLAGLVACGEASEPTLTSQHADPEQVVTATGLADLEIGATRAGLERDRALQQGPGDCAPRLPAHPAVSPVFDQDRLVLLWADPPLHTPDGVAVGSPVAEVHAHHPDAEALPAPAETYQYDGLMVTVDGHAYLFLHDGEQVQKLIVGSEEHARRLFFDGFGTC